MKIVILAENFFYAVTNILFSFLSGTCFSHVLSVYLNSYSL